MATDFAPRNMTSNVLPVPYMAFASSIVHSSNSAWMAFDSGATTRWYSSTTTGWLQLAIGSANPKTLGSYSIMGTNESNTYDPQAWTMLGLNALPGTMTANNAPSPLVASASTEVNSDNAAWKAFDGNLGGTKWLASTTTGWLKIDLGEGNERTLTDYFLSAPDVGNRAPKDWTIPGSNNDSDWDTVDTVTGVTGWAAYELKSFVCDVSTTAYRYFLLNITANDGGTYAGVAEFSLGVGWELLDTVTGETGWGSNEVRDFTCDVATTPYTHFRINITANNGGALVGFSELYLYEAEGAPSGNPWYAYSQQQ